MAKNDKVTKNRACWFGDDMVRVIDIYIPISCDVCNATGKSEDKVPCKNCEGKGVIVDVEGNEQLCPECKGVNKGDETMESSKCFKCKGTGQVRLSLKEAEKKGIKRAAICNFAKCAPSGISSTTINLLKTVKAGDVCRVIRGYDEWMLQVFTAGMTVTVVAVDHADPRLPVRVIGKRKDGKDLPRWAQFMAVKLGKGK